MSVISLYTLLPKNYSFVTQNFFLNIFLIIIFWAVFIGNSWTVDRRFRVSTNSYWKQILLVGTFCNRRRENVKRTKYTLQITLCALYIKLREAVSVNETDLSSYDWLTEKPKDNAVFLYWKCVIDLQIKVLLHVLSFREGNFKLQVEVL